MNTTYFQRSSATSLIDAGGNITSMKRHGGGKSSAAESYVDDSHKNRMVIVSRIVSTVHGTSNRTTNSAIQT